jgi:thiosulfate dehydrogenase [quinone] large subunit
MNDSNTLNKQGEIHIPDPPFAHKLFSTTRFAWLWLLIRLYPGYEFLSAGWGKINNPAWRSGVALQGYWQNAVAIPASGRPVIAFGWYRDFINFMLQNQWYTWFSKVIMFGEFIVGIALILGAFVGIAAFFGGFMNWNYIMAGSASTNGLLFTAAILLILAWKVAGFYGLDRWLLPALGTPWARPAKQEEGMDTGGMQPQH